MFSDDELVDRLLRIVMPRGPVRGYLWLPQPLFEAAETEEHLCFVFLYLCFLPSKRTTLHNHTQ
jgi:hypothetical protein